MANDVLKAYLIFTSHGLLIKWHKWKDTPLQNLQTGLSSVKTVVLRV